MSIPAMVAAVNAMNACITSSRHRTENSTTSITSKKRSSSEVPSFLIDDEDDSNIIRGKLERE